MTQNKEKMNLEGDMKEKEARERNVADSLTKIVQCTYVICVYIHLKYVVIDKFLSLESSTVSSSVFVPRGTFFVIRRALSPLGTHSWFKEEVGKNMEKLPTLTSALPLPNVSSHQQND